MLLTADGTPKITDFGLAKVLHADLKQTQSMAVMGTCGVPNQGDTTVLAAELVCASSVLGTCPDVPGATYPRTTTVTMPAAPPQATMPNPCAGVPPNPWCGSTK